ncbi:uncharacterized protein LOC101854199 [Aplysia californica]|uniref:Uncharacterized protein LOC101854199 n=1 Tax=Aplysia californica TaxID=6500 RepID=A0ABM0K3L8_APLCA|nr:uncharacterized protein LOC101854199 [Aplysia californica]
MSGTTAVIGSVFAGAALIFMVLGFASPYWVESFEEFKGQFVKLGLWEFCFNDYTFYKDYNGKRYVGCFYVFSDDMRPIWEWVSPPWFIGMQVMFSAALLFIFLSCVCLTFYIFRLFPKQIEWAVLIGNGAVMGLNVIVLLIALIVFGVKKEDRRWMPRPDMNLLSWSYGMCCMAGWFCLFSCVCLLLAGKAKMSEKGNYNYPRAAVTYT